MEDRTPKYIVTLSDGTIGQFTEQEYNDNKDEIYGKDRGAQVARINDYSFDDDIDETAAYTVGMPDGSFTVMDANQFRDSRDELRGVEGLQFGSLSPVDYWGEKLDGLNQQIAELEPLYEEALQKEVNLPVRDLASEESDPASAIQAVQERSSISTTRKELSNRLKKLKEEREANPAYQSQKQARIEGLQDYAEGLNKKMSDLNAQYPEASAVATSPLAGYGTGVAPVSTELRRSVEENPEYYRDNSALVAAKAWINDAEKAAKTPSRYDNSRNGFQNFITGITSNVKELSTVLTLAENLIKSAPLIETVKQIQKEEGDNANILQLVEEMKGDPEKMSYLSDAQKSLLEAFIIKTLTDAEVADYASLGYQAGQGAIASVGFMTDFLIFGGIGDAAASGVSRLAGRGVAKFAPEVAKAAFREGISKGTAVAIERAGLQGATEKIAQAIPEIAIGTVKNTVKALAMTPFMPSSYSNLLNNLTQIDAKDGTLDLSGKAILDAAGDVLIETLSENAGGQVEALLGVPFKALGAGTGKLFANTAFGRWGQAMRNAPVTQLLKQAGWNGFIGEMGEEWYGNAIRVMTGVDKDALKNFATVDQQLITMASFAPMSIIGLGASTGQYLASRKQMSDAGERLSRVLAKNNYDEDQIRQILNVAQAENPQELADGLAPVVNQIARDNGDASEAFEAVADYAKAVAQYRVFDGRMSADAEQDRADMRSAITAQMAGDENNWVLHTTTQDDNGRETATDNVRTLTDAQGNEYFVTSSSEEGYGAVSRTDGSHVIVNPTQIEDGTYIDSGMMSMTDFLDREIARRKVAEDNVRMEQEQAVNRSEIYQMAQPGMQINIGSVESPVIGTVLQVQNDQFIIDSERGPQPYTLEQVAGFLNHPLQATPQSEIDERQSDAIKRVYDKKETVNERIRSGNIVRLGGSPVVRVLSPDGATITVITRDGQGNPVETNISEAELDELMSQADNKPVADIKDEETPAPEPEDTTPRDFRGNPLPLKTRNGEQVVDWVTLWNRDPEAWAHYNDTLDNPIVDSKEKLAEAIKDLTKEQDKLSKDLRKEALHGMDENKMDAFQDRLAEVGTRLNQLQNVLNTYNRPAEAGQTIAGEQRQAQAEKTKREQQAGFPGIQQKWDEAEKIVGVADEIRLPNGESIAGHYVMTEAEAPTASHNPAQGFTMTEGFPVDENGKTVNDRDYEHDKAAQQSVLEKAANYDQRALQTPVIVSSDGVVLSGNDRTMASQIAAANNTDGAYLDYLGKYSQKYGFTAQQVGQFQHPRVVFVPDASMPYNAATFAKFNAEEKKSQNKTEKAVKAGKTLTPDALGALATLVDQFDDINALYNDASGVDQLLTILLGAEVISQEQVAALKDGNTLSGAGMDLLESTLIGAALDEEGVRIAMSDKAIRKSVVSAISQIIVGNTLADFSLRTELTDAIALIANGKRAKEIKFGETVQNYVRQQHLFEDDVLAEATVQMLADAINDRRTSYLKKVLSLYNRDAVESANGQMSLLTNDVPSRDAILRNVLEYLGYDTAIIYDTSERGAEQGAEQPAEPEPEEGQDAPVVQGGEGSPAGQVSQYDRERAEVLLEQGNVGELAPYLTDEEITEFLRLWDAFEPYNEALGEAYTRLDADLKSTDKKVKKAAQEEIGRYEAEQEVAFEPVNAFTQTLIEKYGLEEETGYQEPEETDEEEGFEEYDKEDELEEPKQKKGKKAPKKEKEKPFIVVGGASEATIAKQTYTQEELEEFHYTQTYFDRFESKKTKELIQIYGYYHGGTVPDGNNIIHIMRRLPDEEGNYSKDGIFTGPWQAANVELDYLLKYFKANKFKHVGKKEGHKNKYGFWVNPSNVIVNAIEIELPSTHKGWANLNSVEFAQNDEGNWVIGESFHTGTGGYSSGAWNKDKGYEKKSDAIRKLIQDAEEFLNSNFKEDKSKSYEQRDIENLIRTLKTKTLPQALLEEGAVDNFTRVEFTAADYDEGFQGDLFPDEEATAEPAPEGKKPKRKTTAKKAATKKAKPAQKDNVASEEEEEAEPRFTLEDEEGTPGDYHWIEERICTNPTFITLPGDDRLDAVPKVVLAEKDGNWYYNTYLTDDSGKGSSWGSLIPTFKGNYVPYQTREDAVKHAISYIRFVLDGEAKKQQNKFGETFNKAKELIDYLTKMELPQDEFGAGEQEIEAPAPAETKPQAPAYGSQNKIVTTEKYEELKARMQEKLGQLNAGFDPETFFIGAQMAVYHVEAGARKFIDFSQRMIRDLGDAIRPFLKAIYNGARDLPGMEQYREEMTSFADIEPINVDSIPLDFEDWKNRVKEGDVYNGQTVLQVEPTSAGGEGMITTTLKSGNGRSTSSMRSFYYRDVLGEEMPEEEPKVAPVQEVNVENFLGAVNDLAKGKRNEVKLSDFAKKVGESEDNSVNLPPALRGKADARDYRNYITPEAKKLFEEKAIAQGGFKQPKLAYITFASINNATIPVELLETLPEVIAAEQKLKDIQAEAKERTGYDTLQLTPEQVEEYADRLLGESNGSFVKKKDYTGPVARERKAFIVIGRSAAGKSSVFADPLSRDNKARIIDSDIVKPWLENYQDGYGTNYVHPASALVANEALIRAARLGENIVIPRIGGASVIAEIAIPLRAAGYQVELCFNDVTPEASIMRASSRFAETGRFLSLKYLKSIGDKPLNTYRNFATKTIGEALNELSETQIRDLRGRIASLSGLEGEPTGAERDGDRGGYSGLDGNVQDALGAEGLAGYLGLDGSEKLFVASEWKDNNVDFGNPPVEIWNSTSGEPFPFAQDEQKTEPATTIGELGKYTHTKTGKEMTIVRLSGDRLSKEEFKDLKARAKALGGYYSSFGNAKGFLFDNEADAIKFNNLETINNAEEETTEQVAADTTAIVSEAGALISQTETIIQAEEPSERRAAEAVRAIDESLDRINDQLALLGYYEADTTDENQFQESYGYRRTAEKKAVKDADRLAKKLATDLGIEVGRKQLAKANIPPAGGDITFRLPLNEGRELYVDISVEPDRSNEDNLRVNSVFNSSGSMAIMYRVENPSASGLDRYGRNRFADYNVAYSDLLKAIRNEAKDYLPEQAPAQAVGAETDILQVVKEQAEKSRKTAKKSVTSQEDGDSMMGDLFSDLAGEEETAPAPEESTAPSQRVKPTEMNGFAIGEKVLYTPSQGERKTQQATIYDFEYDGRPVLDAGLAPILYEVVEWDTIKKLDEPVNSTENGSERTDDERSEGAPADSVQSGGGAQEAEGGNGEGERQEGGRTDTGGTGRSQSSERNSRHRFDDSVKRNTRNNRVAKGEVVYPKTTAARYRANLEAIRLLKELQDSGKQANKAQMAVLRQYTGWGGLGTYFNNTYTPEHRELKALLTPEEMDAAALSINTAYYTPVEVIDSMWDVAKRLGFEGGNILEGSAGIGNILASMPKNISERSAITAVELDNITGGILEQLYPDATVHIKGFQETDIPNNSVDLAITNVPFGDIQMYDSKEKDLTRKFGGKIHDFCIAKNIRKLAEGGIGIFISTRGTLDNNSKALRQWIVNEGEADVIGAFRLNNETFEGTGATSDIIVVRKRVNGKKSPNAIDVADTVIARKEDYELDEREWNPKTRAWEFVRGKAAMEINSYFVEHPENMGGEMGFGFEHKDTYRPGSSALWPSEKIDQNKRLAKWARQFSDMQAEEQAEARQAETTEAEDSNATKEGQLVTNSKGEICVSRSGKAVPLGLNAQKVKGYSKAQVLTDYNAIKTAINEALDYQLKNESDEGLKGVLDKLNKAYDTFKRKYERINRNPSIAFLRNDVDFSSVAAVESYKETKDINGKVSVSVKKTDIFSKRVLGAKRVPTPKDVKDGIIVSINQYGRIDVPFIATALGKDWEDVQKEIISSGLGYENPQSGNLEVDYEYLSGNVREKLDYAREHNQDGRYDKNIEALEKAVPTDIPAHLIEFSLGSDWMPVELYTGYAKEKLGANDNFIPANLGGSWVIGENTWDMGLNNEKNRSAGVTSEKLRMVKSGHELMIAAMNNSSVVFSKTYKDSFTGEQHTEHDKEATQAAATKISEMREDFKEWARGKMLEDPELAERVGKIYNNTFNAIVPKEISETFIPDHFEGQVLTMGKEGKPFHLYQHQSKAVIRATTEPLMMAHEVGSGKTFTLIASAMEMRRLGTAKKPMIVVQNATLGQFVSSAKELYPNAKVLTISEADRTVEGRSAFYAKIKYNDWDMIIVPQSVFEMIPDSEERQRAYIQEKIEEKEFILAQAKQANNEAEERRLKQELEDLQYEYQFGEKPPKKGKGGKRDAKKEAEAKANAVAKAKKQLDRRTDDVSDFDDMGIDALLIDEAHNYKHLGFSTAMQRGVKGVDPKGSKKSAGVYLKTRAVFDKVGWKNVVFATGTPISNTAAEIWTFMKYLMPAETMRKNHIYYFDDFVRNFGNISQSLEFASNGKFKENTRFASYTNLPELMRIWMSVADIVLTKEAVAAGGEKLDDKLPKMEGGQARDIYLPQSASLVDIMNAVRAKLEWYEGLSGKEKKEYSYIPLNMYGIAKMAAIDPRLVDKNAKDEPQSKTNKAVEETLKALEDSKKFNGTAALFCDNFRRWDYTEDGKKVEGFNIFDEIKRKLLDAGVPAEQITIMKGGMTTAAKEKIFAKVNAGEIRVIMGSTETLGTGVNIQERLFFEAHIDAPNRPMDYTQRMGRILRQGNLLKDWGIEARVVRFGVEDSLDVTAYQRLATKSKFIDSVMNGKPLLANGMDNRVLEEEEDGIFDEPVAVLSGSQYALLKSQAERELRKLRNKKEQHKQDQIYIEKALKDNNNRIEFNQKLIEEGKKNLEKTKEAFPDGKVTEIAIEGKKVKPDQIAATLKEKITGPLREYLEKNRENGYFHDETKEYNMTFDGVPVKISVAVSRTSGYDERLRRFSNQMHALVEYSAPRLGINGRTVPGGVNGISGIIPDFQEKIASGSYYENGIRNMESTISRLTSDNDLMLQRRGKPFADEEKLKQQEEVVKDYTEKMKAEMAEKEAKYAEVAKNATTNFNLDNVEVEDEPQGEDSTSYRDVDENAPKLDVNDPFVLAEAVSAVNRLARRIGLRVNFDETLDAKGAYTEGNDYVSINLANCESVDDAIETLLHEGVAHLGLRKLFGKEGFSEFINDILDNSSRSIRDAIDNLVAENGWSREYAAEEYIAELAQRTDYTKMERSFWRKVVDAVRDLISMITGRPVRITDGTIREMLLASYENLGVEYNDTDFYNENWEGYTHFRERSIARDLYDRYENQNGEDKPWMSERELMDMAQAQLPYGIGTKPLFAMIDEYNRLDEEDFNEGRRDFSGGEMEDLFDRFLSALRDLGNSTARNRTAGVEMFISNAENAVNSISMEKATPQQWLKMIESKGGLKAGEDKWIGLSDWLKASQKKTLTKQEVQDYINQNKIQIEEVRYADAEDIAADGREWNEAVTKRFGKEVFDAYHFEWDDDGEIELWTEDEDKAAELYNKFHKELGIEHELFTKPTDDYYTSVDMRWLNEFGLRIAQYGDEQMEKQFGKTINPTRIDYTTSNLDNKREIALTVPTIVSWRKEDKVHFGDAGEGRAIAWIRFGDTRMKRGEGFAPLFVRYIGEEPQAEARKKAIEGILINWNDNESLMRNERPDEQFFVARSLYKNAINDNLYGLTQEQKDQAGEIIYALDELRPEDFEPTYEDGKRVLVIDEIQSNRHQEGRERGYTNENTSLIKEARDRAEKEWEDYSKELRDKYKLKDDISYVLMQQFHNKATTEEFQKAAKLNQAVNTAQEEWRKVRDTVPAAPFDKNWHELAMKRMLRYAAENEYDAIAWTTGEQQADRYALSEYINGVQREDNSEVYNGKRFVLYSGRKISLGVNDEGKVEVSSEDSFVENSLSDIVGKEVAVKMMTLEDGEELNTEDLKIGGEGMKGFYDEILPRFMNKYGKKWGVSVKDMELPIGEDGKEVMHAVEVTPEMRESVMQGQLMFRQGGIYSPSPVSYSESMGAKRLAANETASKFGVDIEFAPSSEMRFNGMPLAGRWINGKMYICLEHCRDNNDVIRTVLHEGVGHNGLRRLIGDDNMRDFCLDLFTSLPKAVRNKIATDAVNKYGGNIVSSVENFTANDVIREIGKDAMFESTEEWLAETSETIDYDNYRRNVWDIIRDALRRVLAKVGINVPLSTRDVKWLMVQSAFANHENNPLVEARRQVVAKGLGMTLRQQAEVGEARQNARNRLATETLAPAARIYNKDVMNWMSRLHETWVDKDDSVHRLVNAIEKATGKKAAAFEDIRLALNQQSSKGLAAIEKFEREHYQPMMDAIKALMEEKGCDLKDIERYVMIKHALERNEVFAKRDAREYYEAIHDANVKKIQDSDLEKDEKDRLITKEDSKLNKHYTAIENGTDVKYAELREQDYGGLTSLFSEYDDIEPFRQGIESNEEYQARVLMARHPKFQFIDANGRPVVDMEQTEKAAQEEIDTFENGHAKAVDKLWKEINGATKATLLHQYQANMLSRDQYTKVRDMFKYYVPLRGFADNTAEDMYDYYRSDQRNDFTPPLLKAKGRKTEAESPFGYIGSMASSGIAADMKNETKLALYYFVSNRAKNDLVNISEVWYEKTGEDSDGKSIFSPVYPPFKEDLSSDEAKKEYEEWEKAMIEKAQDGLAFKGRRKLDLHNSVINIDNRQKNSHIIKFKVGGKDMMMYINGNPRAAQAINNELNVEMSTDYQKVFGKVLRWFSGINTSYNPEFWLSNAQRDALFALMSVNVKEDTEYNRAFRKNFGSLLRRTLTPGAKGGAYSLKKKLDEGRLGDDRLDKLYAEFVENGGVTGYTTLKNNEEWELELRKYTGDEKAAIQAVKTVFQRVQNFGEAIEQMTRFAAYMTSREQGKEVKDAVNDAKDLTVNFNRKGSGKAISFKEADRLRTNKGEKLTGLQKAFVVGASWIPVYGRRFIMFFNASTQGLNAMYKLFSKNPSKMAIWTAGYLALGVIQAALHAMLDDDDDYLDIPDYERRNNLLLGGDGVYLKWALPQESRVFYALGDMMVNHAMGREPHRNMVGELLSAAADIAPLNPTGGIAALAPSAVSSVVEVALNRDYKGAKIFNDLKYLSDEERKQTPAYQKAFRGTGKPYIMISKFANWLSGGDYADAGWLNINPAAVEHIVQGATGGAGTTVGKFYRGTIGQIFGEDFMVRNTPFLSRILTVTDDRYRNAHTTDLFDYYKAEAEHTKKRIKTYEKNGDFDKLDKIYDSEDYEIMLIYDSYKSILNWYNDELKFTEDNDERRELMREQDSIRKEMIQEISNIGNND